LELLTDDQRKRFEDGTMGKDEMNELGLMDLADYGEEGEDELDNDLGGYAEAGNDSAYGDEGQDTEGSNKK
jgi:hypothetical protein